MTPHQTCEGWSELPVWNGLDGFKQRSVALQGWGRWQNSVTLHISVWSWISTPYLTITFCRALHTVSVRFCKSSGVQVSVITLVYCVKWLLNPHGNTEATNLSHICPLRFAMAKINIYIFLCTPVHSPTKQMAPEVARSEVCSLQEAGAN